MATLYAQANGNYTSGAWSAADLWNTAANGSGTDETPTSADTLISNNFTITINDALTVTKVTNTGGGTFTLGNGSHLTCTDGTAGVVGDATNNGAVTFELTGEGESATLTANVKGGNGLKEWGINFTGTSALTINGSVTGGSHDQIDLTLTAHGVYINGEGMLVIANGTSTAVSGGTLRYNAGVYCASVGATVIVTGNLAGANVTSTHAIYAAGAAIITVTGSLLAGSLGSAISAAGAATITVTGALTAATAEAISATGVATIIVNGTLQASPTKPAISSTNVGADVRLTGPLLTTDHTYTGGASAAGVNPILCARWFIKETALETFRYALRSQDIDGGIRAEHNLYVGTAAPPLQADVRYGTAYGAGAFTGTCYVPAAASVLVGVPVDNTVGTAQVNSASTADIAAAVWDTLVADLDTANSIGARLAQAATVPSTGAQIAALGV